jgi:hypothetical protein
MKENQAQKQNKKGPVRGEMSAQLTLEVVQMHTKTVLMARALTVGQRPLPKTR